MHYVSTENPWGNTSSQVQKALLDRYHSKNVKLLVSCFGATDFPTSAGADPVETGKSIANFVIQNQLDGVDLDWEDNDAMNAGKGEAWLVSITRTLRQYLPREKGYIISHAPQAPYFMGPPKYPNGGYLTVDKQVGDLIDFYNVQFYNQDSSTYSSYETLFTNSNGWATGTSVFEMVARGIPLQKIVIGKPVSQADVVNSGFVPVQTLVAYFKNATRNSQWRAGFMGWQFPSDSTDWSTQLASAFP